MSSRDSHLKPEHRVAPDYSGAAGQTGGFWSAYHRDKAVLCKAQGERNHANEPGQKDHKAAFQESEY